MSASFLPLWIVFALAGSLGLVGWPHWRPAAAIGVLLALTAMVAFLEDIADVGWLGNAHLAGAVALFASLQVQGWRQWRKRARAAKPPPP
jgi:hypothetical protein